MTETIILGGGCFWCTEAAYKLIKGVTEVTPGYAGGSDAHPTYDSVCSGTTGHAEVVRITFDPSTLGLHDILSVFWVIHDPTTPNRQGADIGTQYRSIILYTNPSQLAVISNSLAEAKNVWGSSVSTEIKACEMFYEAETYHHNYFENHPEQSYCQLVINPKLHKLRQKLSALIA